MFDMLKTLKLYLAKDATINQYCKSRIRAYTIPETADRTDTNILIIPLIAPTPSTYASDKNLTTDYLYQIDVRSKSYEETKLVSEAIRLVMKSIGFGQQDGTDEYDSELKAYFETRRYRGNPYTIDELRHIDKDIEPTLNT